MQSVFIHEMLALCRILILCVWYSTTSYLSFGFLLSNYFVWNIAHITFEVHWQIVNIPSYVIFVLQECNNKPTEYWRPESSYMYTLRHCVIYYAGSSKCWQHPEFQLAEMLLITKAQRHPLTDCFGLEGEVAWQSMQKFPMKKWDVVWFLMFLLCSKFPYSKEKN